MRWTALALVLVVALAACDTTPPELPPREQTVWRGFRFAPDDTIAVGDTVTVTAVIRDSLDARFEYCWTPPFGRERAIPEPPQPGNFYCPGRTVQFIAPETLGEGVAINSFRFNVTTDNGVYIAQDGARLTRVSNGDFIYVQAAP
ncbi:MAG: hypothetical protein AAGJ92_07650 [Pseudomonadota bacterium]